MNPHIAIMKPAYDAYYVSGHSTRLEGRGVNHTSDWESIYNIEGGLATQELIITRPLPVRDLKPVNYLFWERDRDGVNFNLNKSKVTTSILYASYDAAVSSCLHIFNEIESVLVSRGANTILADEDYKIKARATLLSITILDKQDEREASFELMTAIERKVKQRDMKFINEMLFTLSGYNLSTRSLVALIRSTYRLKRQLPAWVNSFEYIDKSLKSKGVDSAAWLVGLKK